MRNKAKARANKALRLAVLSGPTKAPLTPISGLPVAVSATSYRTPNPALSGLRAYGSGLTYTPPNPYYGPNPPSASYRTGLNPAFNAVATKALRVSGSAGIALPLLPLPNPLAVPTYRAPKARPYYVPLTALGPNRVSTGLPAFKATKPGKVKGRVRRSKRVALRVAVGVNPNPAYAKAPLVGPTALPLPSSAVKYVSGLAARITRLYGPNLSLSPVNPNSLSPVVAGYVKVGAYS
jgi:hypothetical protein